MSEPSSLPPLRAGRVLVVANPIAGRGRGETLGREAVERLRRRGVAAALHLTASDIPAAIAGHAPDAVIAVGGDGTVRTVLEALPDPALPVGVVPAGTANVLARDLGIPRRLDRALDVVLAGRRTRLDVATAGGRLAVIGASAGFDARVVHEVARRRTGAISQLTYVAAALRLLPRYRPPRLAAALEGEAVPGRFGLVIAANVVHYGAHFRLWADRRVDDGRFEVYLFRDARWPALALAALAALRGRLCPPDWGRRTGDAGTTVERLGGRCEMRLGRHVRVTSESPVPCQVDGDPAGDTPLELLVQPVPRTVLAP